MTDTVNMCYTFIYLLWYLKKNTHSWSLSMTALTVINSHTERNEMEKYVGGFFQNIGTSY